MTTNEPKKPEEMQAASQPPKTEEKPKEIVPKERIFIYDGREFQDPDPKMTPDEIRQYYTTFFPELANAEILAPVARPGKTPADPGRSAIEFKRRVGTKGRQCLDPRHQSPCNYDGCPACQEECASPEELKAKEMWKAMDKNEQAGVRFGMLPYHKMMEAEKAGFDGRKLAVSLMQCAKDNGGMVA